jgi:ferredoxin
VIRIVTDLDRCAGNALCAGTAPAIFDVSEDGYVLVLEQNLTDAALAAAHRAAKNCPTGAITVMDEAG